MKIENMKNSNGGKIANQFIIEDGGYKIFQSYKNIIAKQKNGNVTLDKKAWNYSRTTSKYLNQFLGISAAIFNSNMNAGVYKLANLNK